MRIAVYTAIVGHFDSLKTPTKPDSKIDYFAFVEEDLNDPVWQYMPLDRSEELINRRLARKHKILPHKYIPGYDYYVWVDGSFHLHGNPREPIKRYLKKAHVAARVHPNRRPLCAYAEAKACMKQGKDDEQTIQEQIDRYESEQYPHAHGLVDTAFFLWKSHDNTWKFAEAWWGEIMKGSLRDQISVNYAAWKTGIHLQIFPTGPKRSDAWVRYMGHGNKKV
jgi:hypothetical protein